MEENNRKTILKPENMDAALHNLQCDITLIDEELKGLHILLNAFYYGRIIKEDIEPMDMLQEYQDTLYFTMQSIDGLYSKYEEACNESERAMFGRGRDNQDGEKGQ